MAKTTVNSGPIKHHKEHKGANLLKNTWISITREQLFDIN